MCIKKPRDYVFLIFFKLLKNHLCEGSRIIFPKRFGTDLNLNQD